MKTYFLIDGTNNNKVLNIEFASHEEAIAYVDAKEHTENWENGWETFEDFKDEFYTVDSDQMEEAVRTHGPSKRNYWN